MISRVERPDNPFTFLSQKYDITMPLKKKSRAPRRKPAVRRAFGRRPRVARKSNIAEHASCSVKRTLVPSVGPAFVTNQMYEIHNVQIAQFPRALAIAKAYQFYKIKYVALTMKFPYDTYLQGVGNNISRPNFYYMLDKAQAIPIGVNLEGLKQMGARPRACDEKPITIRWSPTVLTEDETLAGALPSQYKTSPWLSSDVTNVLHNGIYWYADQQFPPVDGLQYQVEVEVQFEFKKPLWDFESSGPTAVGAKPALLDNSPDGVVGGGDELMSPSLG